MLPKRQAQKWQLNSQRLAQTAGLAANAALASIYILRVATKFGVSRITIARMSVKIIVDLLVGAFPIVGDIFDVYWKANRKNVELLLPYDWRTGP